MGILEQARVQYLNAVAVRAREAIALLERALAPQEGEVLI